MKDTRGEVVYVGKAQSLRHRVRSYWQKQALAPLEGHRIRSVGDTHADIEEPMHRVRRLLPFRTCTIYITAGVRALQRPCLLYHIKRCQGPCIQAISKDDYRADIAQIELFLEGRQETLVKALQAEMGAASNKL